VPQLAQSHQATARGQSDGFGSRKSISSGRQAKLDEFARPAARVLLGGKR